MRSDVVPWPSLAKQSPSVLGILDRPWRP